MFNKILSIAVLICLSFFVFTACGDTNNTREQFSPVPTQSPITGKWGYVCPVSGEQIIECKYDTAHQFCEGLAAVKLNGKCGYIDENGNTKIQHKYCYANNFNNGSAQVGLNGKNCRIDRNGNVINQGNNNGCKCGKCGNKGGGHH
jgi:hypothetical protein